MKYILFTLITFCLTSCGLYSWGERSYTYVADPVIDSYGLEMSKKRGYWVDGTGGSMPNSDVYSLFMSFEGLYEVDVAEARRLYVEAVEGLTKRINEDKTIRPYLHDYPATFRTARIHLSFVDKSYNPVSENHIAFVTCVDDIVYYNIFNHTKRDYKDVYREPYEEALRIVQGEFITSN